MAAPNKKRTKRHSGTALSSRRTAPQRDARVLLGELVEQPGRVPFGVRVVRQVAPAAEFLLHVVEAFGISL
jgi:hypothetical protein